MKTILKAEYASIGYEPDFESRKVLSVLWREKFKNAPMIIRDTPAA